MEKDTILQLVVDIPLVVLVLAHSMPSSEQTSLSVFPLQELHFGAPLLSASIIIALILYPSTCLEGFQGDVKALCSCFAVQNPIGLTGGGPTSNSW